MRMCTFSARFLMWFLTVESTMFCELLLLAIKELLTRGDMGQKSPNWSLVSGDGVGGYQ